MRLQLAWTLALAAVPAAAGADDGSWIFAPTRYTHSPLDGQRVVQYCPEAPPSSATTTPTRKAAIATIRSAFARAIAPTTSTSCRPGAWAWGFAPTANGSIPIAPAPRLMAPGRCLILRGRIPLDKDLRRTGRLRPFGPISNRSVAAKAVTVAVKAASGAARVANGAVKVASGMAANPAAASGTVKAASGTAVSPAAKGAVKVASGMAANPAAAKGAVKVASGMAANPVAAKGAGRRHRLPEIDLSGTFQPASRRVYPGGWAAIPAAARQPRG